MEFSFETSSSVINTDLQTKINHKGSSDEKAYIYSEHYHKEL